MKVKIGIDRSEGEECFLSEGQEDGHEMNGTNQDMRWKYGIKQGVLRVYFRAAI